MDREANKKLGFCFAAISAANRYNRSSEVLKIGSGGWFLWASNDPSYLAGYVACTGSISVTPTSTSMKSRICLEVESDPTLHISPYLSISLHKTSVWKKNKKTKQKSIKKYRNLTPPIATVPSLHMLARIGRIGHQHIILWKWGLDPWIQLGGEFM